LASGVPVNLPDSRANALDQEQDQVTIAIDKSGQVYFDDKPLGQDGVAQAIGSIGCGSDRLVTLRADRSLDYGKVMGVMGELNHAGCKRISLVTSGSVEAP